MIDLKNILTVTAWEKAELGKKYRFSDYIDCVSESSVIATLDEVRVDDYPFHVASDGGWYRYICPVSDSDNVTYLELLKWLAQGKGMVQLDNSFSAMTTLTVGEADLCRVVAHTVKVRKWGDDKWHDPTQEYLGVYYDE